MINLTGKVILITGGSRGIGASVALMAAKAGAVVVINYKENQSKARTVLNRIKKFDEKTKSIIFKADVSNKASIRKMFQKIKSEFGRLDILINNAGVWKMAPIVSMTDAELEETVNVNFIGAFNCIREGAKLLSESGNGVIINISSTAARRGEAFYSHYSSTKAALIGLTKSLAVELASYGIRVNAVAPGWVNTDMSAKVLEEKGKDIKEKIPLGRIAEPEDIAGPVVFLCSDLASFINGAVIDVNGGSVLID
jgi:3-oxoacyl-[acyl-carrier protein] reductase